MNRDWKNDKAFEITKILLCKLQATDESNMVQRVVDVRNAVILAKEVVHNIYEKE